MNQEETHIHSIRAARPQIHHAESRPNSSAGYLSDYASDASSGQSATGYETPPSRVSTPVPPPNTDLLNLQQQPFVFQSDMTLPARPAPAVPAPLNIRQNEQGQPRTVRSVPSWDIPSPPTPDIDDTPYIRFAIEQLTFDEELLGQGRHSPDSSYEEVLHRPSDEAALRSGYGTQIAQPQNLPIRPALTQTGSQSQAFRFPSQGATQPQLRSGEEMLVPSDPPFKRHPLGYIPVALRPVSLIALLLLCILVVIGLIISNVYALRNHGLYDYDGNTSARYFVFQYLPPLIGMIIIFWLFIVQAAIYRALPYVSMSNGLPGTRRDRLLQNMPIVPANFVLPDWRFFKLGEPLVAIVLLIFWLMNLTVPLLGCLYSTQWYTNVGTPRWRWTTVQGLGWFLMIMYIMLIAALCYCVVRFRSRFSALMWDPKSLADMIVLFQNSNILPRFAGSEINDDLHKQLEPRFCRLGYWMTTRDSEAFYAVGEANRPAGSASPRFSGEKQIHQQASGSLEGDNLSDSQNSSVGRKTLNSPYLRRWAPWYLHDSAVLAWGIAAVLLLTAFLVVSFVNNAVQRGFYPLLEARTNASGFSSANFLYSFLPGLLGMILFLVWQPIDTYFRVIQPYCNLSNADGATAWRSLLQSYLSMEPGMVTAVALRNGDFKVAYISFVSLLAIPIPALASGVFTAQLFPASNEVRMVASMPGYIALCFFLSVYALSYLVIWPKRKRYLPHSINTIAGNLSFLYASSLLRIPSIRNSNQIRRRSDLVDRLSGYSQTGLTGDGRRKRSEKHDEDITSNTRYAFGVFNGVDGKEHLGIDRYGAMVITGTPGHRS